MKRGICTGRAVGVLHIAVLAAGLCAPALQALAQEGGQALLIRNATVHTAGPQGTLEGSDVLVQGGAPSARSARPWSRRPGRRWWRRTASR